MKQGVSTDPPWLGLLSGLAGGVGMNLWSYAAYLTRLTRTWNSRVMAVALLRHQPRTAVEHAVGILYDLTFTGFLGIALAMLLSFMQTRHPRVFGWFFGVAVSLMALVLASFSGVDVFPDAEARSILVHFTTASVWGLITTHLLLRPGPVSGAEE